MSQPFNNRVNGKSFIDSYMNICEMQGLRWNDPNCKLDQKYEYHTQVEYMILKKITFANIFI